MNTKEAYDKTQYPIYLNKNLITIEIYWAFFKPKTKNLFNGKTTEKLPLKSGMRQGYSFHYHHHHYYSQSSESSREQK